MTRLKPEKASAAHQYGWSQELVRPETSIMPLTKQALAIIAKLELNKRNGPRFVIQVKLRPDKNETNAPAKGARNINRMKMEDSP